MSRPKPVSQQVILITGATDGLGRQLAGELAGQGATLLLHGRDQARGDGTLAEIRKATGNDRLTYYRADFASLDEARDLARRIVTERDRIDVLVNNAGIGAGPRDHQVREVSRDGVELRFAVNYLAPFLLTHHLLPLLKASAPSRIVNVASAGQAPIDFNDPMLEHGYSGARAYAQSKLALIMFTLDLAHQLQGTGVTANVLHPATYMDTKMVFESVGYNLSSIRDGVASTIRLVIDAKLEGVSGRYYDQLRESRANSQAYEQKARAQLRVLSEQLTRLTPTRV